MLLTARIVNGKSVDVYSRQRQVCTAEQVARVPNLREPKTRVSQSRRQNGRQRATANWLLCKCVDFWMTVTR